MGQGQVRLVTETVKAILDFPVPPSKKELCRFLEMCGYYQGVCRNFSDVVAPVMGQVSPSKSFVWSAACQAAFQSANFSWPVKLEVGASA